jgi:hypothetical protein
VGLLERGIFFVYIPKQTTKTVREWLPAGCPGVIDPSIIQGLLRIAGEAVIDAQVGYDMVHSLCPLPLSSSAPSLSLPIYRLFLFSPFLLHLLSLFLLHPFFQKPLLVLV